jgi:hypothetical protein
MSMRLDLGLPQPTLQVKMTEMSTGSFFKHITSYARQPSSRKEWGMSLDYHSMNRTMDFYLDVELCPSFFK